ncbi:MAG: hypothetical protein HZA21_00925 [Nitrospirae bacterium]|nr:hypothetical protein [Nitrospirota bacterium]
MRHFDYETVAREAGIPDDKLKELCRLIRLEFPTDEMMCELHLLRACLAIRDGLVRLEDALRGEFTAA